MVTIRQIAEKAGVSRATVDKVIHNRPGVSDSVRQHVQDILTELNYEPNVIGKALAARNKTFIIGVILLEKNSFFAKVQEGVEAAAKEGRVYGIEFVCRTLPDIDVDVQLQMIEELKAQGMSALAIVPIEDTRIRDAIDCLTEEGIPVVVFNSDIPDSQRKCFIGQNHIKGGMTAGDLMGRLLDGCGETAIFTSSRKVLAQKERVKGFCQVLEEDFSQVRVVDIIENTGEEKRAYENTIRLLEQYPNLEGIYLTGGNILGVKNAILKMKRPRIKVVTFDATEEKIKMLQEGILDFTIDQKPYEQGYQSIKVLTNWLIFQQEPQKIFIEIPIDIKTKHNI